MEGALQQQSDDMCEEVMGSGSLGHLSACTAAAATAGDFVEVKEEKRRKEKEGEEGEPLCQRVRIQDPSQVYDALNLGRRIDVVWPDERMRQRGGRSHWRDWLPERGMEGRVVHRWVPSHPLPRHRSNVDRTILLVQIGERFVPIAEAGTQDLGAEVGSSSV